MAPALPDPDDGELMTIAQAAEAAGVQPATVRQWIRRHGLQAWRVDGRVLVQELPVLRCERARRLSGRRRRDHADTP